jgi:hypothetical protein
MNRYYTSIPDLFYLWSGDCSSNRQDRSYIKHKSMGLFRLTDVWDYIKKSGRAISINDLGHALDVCPAQFNQLRHTVSYFEQEGRISYVPDYERGRLLFCSTKLFRSTIKPQILKQCENLH